MRLSASSTYTVYGRASSTAPSTGTSSAHLRPSESGSTAQRYQALQWFKSTQQVHTDESKLGWLSLNPPAHIRSLWICSPELYTSSSRLLDFSQRGPGFHAYAFYGFCGFYAFNCCYFYVFRHVCSMPTSQISSDQSLQLLVLHSRPATPQHQSSSMPQQHPLCLPHTLSAWEHFSTCLRRHAQDLALRQSAGQPGIVPLDLQYVTRSVLAWL